jgi:signal transduction histidine kinase
MTFQITPWVYANLFTAAISFVVAVLAWRRRSISGAIALAWLMIAVGEWAFASAFEIASTSISAKVFWSQVEYFGNLTSPVLLLVFVFDFTGARKWLTLRSIALLFAIPLFSILLAVTNEWHHLIWTSFTPTENNLLIFGHGIWFWVIVAFSYAMLGVSIVFLGRIALHLRGLYASQVRMILFAALVPCVWNVLYVFDLSPVPGLDLTPIAFAVSGWLLAWAILRMHLLDLVPIARDAVIENMLDGVIVLDMQNRIVDINIAAQEFLRLDAPIGKPIAQVYAPLAYGDDQMESSKEICIEHDLPHYFDVRYSPVRDQSNQPIGRLIVLRDVTRRKQMQADLEEWNTKLENQVADRTAELQETIHKLEAEIAQRARVEHTLRQMEDALAQRVSDQSRQLTALYEVILIAGQTESVQKIEEQLLDKVIAVVGGAAGCIHELSAVQNNLGLVAHLGLADSDIAHLEALSTDWVLGDQVPRAINDFKTSTSTQVHLDKFGAYLGAPINLRSNPIGVLSVFWKNPQSFSVENIALFSAIADQFGIIIENTRLRQLSEQRAALQERRRLARDLHDSVTQSLHSLVLSSETATNRLRLGKLDRLESSLAQLAESARQALKEMRLLLYELRLVPLEEVRMIEALQIRLDAVERRAGIKSEFNLEGAPRLSPIWEKELYCIAMEALNNSLRHARATQVAVTMRVIANGIELEIADNGIGIDPLEKKSGGMGLANMVERTERIGGVLEVQSAPDQGTRIYVRVEEAK